MIICEICGEDRDRVSVYLKEQFHRNICLNCEPELVRPLFEKILENLCFVGKLANVDFLKQSLKEVLRERGTPRTDEIQKDVKPG